MALFNGRAGRLTSQNGGFRAGQWEHYVAAMYWTICTITTVSAHMRTPLVQRGPRVRLTLFSQVGYGDISAHSLEERNMAILSTAVGATTFAFVCGNMTSLVVGMDKVPPGQIEQAYL